MPRAKEIFPLAILVTRAISTPVTKKGIKITGVAGWKERREEDVKCNVGDETVRVL